MPDDKTKQNPPVASNGLQANTSVPNTSPAQVLPAQAILDPLGVNSNFADILLKKGLINRPQYDQIKVNAINSGKAIEDVIVQSNLISEEKLFQIKAEIYNIPYVKLSEINIPVETLNKFEQKIARKNMAIAFEESPILLKVAMLDPLDIQKVKYLSTIVGKKIEPYFADAVSINNIIDTRYGAQIGTEVTEALEDVGDVVNITNTLSETEDLQSEISAAPVARIVNMMLEFAVKNKASDLHIEPHEGRIVARYRISGVLTEKLNLPKKLGNAVVSRIKILSNLKIDEHRVPQDGRFQIKVEDFVIDLRVSIMPSVYGEKVVIRLLEKGGTIISLDETGIRGRSYQLYLEALKKTQGIILVTGPTGSGKTVTLASSLKILNKPEVNIMTMEDPVEIRIEGVTQVQVNPEVGLTFAKGLRSFLRQDPDIIMVGEIRDRETAELAVQASLTGHLVLATLHTNSAAGALPRLTDMGVEPFLLASTVNIISAQRLARKVCENCKTKYEASSEDIKVIKEVLDELKGFDFEVYLAKQDNKIHMYKGQGCPKCSDSGFDGRIGIFELFHMSDKISAMTLSRQSSNVIEQQAIEEGMITMKQDGFLKVLEGVTTIEEVLRVIS